METINKSQEIKAEENLPGAAMDAADKDRVTKEEVKADVSELNNLPYVSNK